MRERWPLQLTLLCLLVGCLGLLFAQEPGFGDDLTYWTYAHDLHEIGFKAYNVQSFHDLRWPVWGVSYILQGIGLRGVASFSGVAICYLMAGAACSFTFGRLATRSLPVAWAAGLAFLFCPLIDTVAHRPMPDLSEGIWMAAAILAWRALMLAENKRSSVFWAMFTGLFVFITESNRLTGVFVVPILFIATLLWARRRFGWLVVAGVFAAAFYACEAAFYHHLFHDWLHNLHANMNGKGNKGTSGISFVTSPFRFLYAFWKVKGLTIGYTVLAAIGLTAVALRRPKQPPLENRPLSSLSIPTAPLIALWFIVLYLEYACAPQSLSPWQPVVRDGARFLGGLAIPFSLLAVLGVYSLLSFPWLQSLRPMRWVSAHWVIPGVALVAAFLALTSRSYFDLGFLPEMKSYVRSVPNGTRIFTHHLMRTLAIMADPSSEKRLQWADEREILDQTPALEQSAASADEFWYIHKVVWMANRRHVEKGQLSQQRPLGSYFENTMADWALAKVLIKDNSPDLVFFRRRTPAMPTPQPLTAASPEVAGILPETPLTWKSGQARSLHLTWKIPPEFHGQCLRLDLVASSDAISPASITFRFNEGNKISRRDLSWKPYVYPEQGHDFYLLPIPLKAKSCQLHVRFAKAVKAITVTRLDAVVVRPLIPTSERGVGSKPEAEHGDDAAE